MDLSSLFLVLIPLLTSLAVCQLEEFVSIDCGGTSNYSDTSTGLAWISDSSIMQHGISVEVENPNGRSMLQYQKRRDFPIDSNKKYCYTLSTEERRRYLVRATFQYGSLDSGDTYPQFQLYLDATKWATVSIYDASRVYVKEMIIRAPSNSIDVCMCCATTGSPFISTLELRPLNLSMYATDFEDNFFLEVAARINFGAPTEDAVRYPDDPYDRIWDSDLIKRQNYLVGVAPGTERISTTKNIDIETREYPPVKVMQSAVVGTKGVLSYRLNLEDFPANARAYAYFAEIEDLGQNESRKFKLKQPYIADYSNAVVNIAENANGSYTLYEPSYMNVTLEFVLSFSFVMAPDSTRGPLLNALEINCFKDRQARLILSRRNVKGEISPELSNMEALTELWLDGNLLTGQLPDMSKLINLKIVHLENNKLTGRLPSYMGSLPSLQALFIQNNSFSGEIPAGLISKKIVFNYDGNPELYRGNKKHFKMVVGISIGVLVILLILFLVSLVLLLKTRRKASQKKREEKGISGRTNSKPGYSFLRGGNLMDENTTCHITLSELKEATDNFSKKIGKGSFGSVYYGKMRDGKEIAVKKSSKKKNLDWLTRLRIAEDAAKGLEYLHTGCNPSIIHRDIKTGNILLDINMRAKVSDFGLSRLAEEDLTHISSIARGTVGYLDPEYYASQQLTEKSDVYSFGVVLLELISGKKPVSSEDYGDEMNIVHWARSLTRKGDAMSIIDPSLAGNAKTESIWRVVEIAMQCVAQHGASRPRMQEIILAIQDATKIEKGTENKLKSSSFSGSSSSKPQHSSRKTLLTSFLEIESPDVSNGCLPSAR
ncbi:putative LRR receptor-like serine/threonine-protein kinase [Glycine max]|nr:putative LRR receptor-like serine/threonine-protein kinase [Glycine max]